MKRSFLPKSCGGAGILACCTSIMFLTLSGCGQNRDADNATTQSENLQGDMPAIAESQNVPVTADDPLLQGDNVVIHEYGDSHIPPSPAPGKSTPTAGPKMLSAAVIRKQVVGHELTDGAHWSWKFRPGGRLVAEENGRESTGRWRLKGDQLCIDVGYGSVCHTVSRQNGFLQLWGDGTVWVEAELH